MHSASAVSCSVTTLWAFPISVASETLDATLLKSIHTHAAEIQARYCAAALCDFGCQWVYYPQNVVPTACLLPVEQPSLYAVLDIL
jgi:hypothetical protein